MSLRQHLFTKPFYNHLTNTNTSTHDMNPKKPWITTQRYHITHSDHKHTIASIVWGFQLHLILVKLIILHFKNYCHYGYPTECEVIFHWGFYLYFLMNNDIEHLSMCLFFVFLCVAFFVFFFVCVFFVIIVVVFFLPEEQVCK